MKTCPNCGHQMPDEAKYCDACGAMFPAGDPAPAAGQEDAPVQEPVAPPEGGNAPVAEPVAPMPEAPQPPEDRTPAQVPQGNSKKPMIIGAVAVAVVCIGAGVFFMMNRGGGGETKLPADPAGQFKAIQTGYVDGMFTSLDNTPVNTIPEKVSTDLTITAQYDDDGEISSYLEGTSIGMQVDATQNSAMLGMDFIFKNTPIVSGTLTYEDGILGLCVPELADNYYTMDLARLLERYAEEEIPDLEQVMTSSTISPDDIHTFLNSYLGVLLTAVNNENTVKEEDVSFTLDMLGEDRTGTRYTVTPTEKDLEEMLLALADQLEKDKLLRKILTSSGTATLELPDLEEQIADMVQSLRDGAADVARQLAGEHFAWILCTDKDAVKQTFSADSLLASWESSETGVAARITALGEEILNFSFADDALFFTMIADEEEITVTGSFGEEKGLYSGEINASFGTEAYLYLAYRDVSLDKASALGLPYGSYGFSMWDDYTEFTLRFDVQAAENGGTDHILALSMPDASTEEFDLDKLTLVINSTDKSTTIQKPTSPQVDVTDYTEEDFNALINEMSDAATALLFKLMMALYS